jgi:hypothetical protein
VKHYSDVTGHYVRFDTRSADEETVNIRVADLLRQLPRGDKLTVILDHGDRRTSERVLMAGDQFAYRGRNRTAGLLAMHTLNYAYSGEDPVAPPRPVYTCSAPGTCPVCKWKAVVTRDGKDICEACALK